MKYSGENGRLGGDGLWGVVIGPSRNKGLWTFNGIAQIPCWNNTWDNFERKFRVKIDEAKY